MTSKNQDVLTEDLLEQLRNETFVSLITVDHENKMPYVSAISWVYAPDQRTIRFSVDSSSKNVENVKKNDGVVITVMENGTTYAISCKGIIVKERLEDVPIDLTLVECAVQEVRDIMFYGGKLVNEPDIEKTYDEEAAQKLDNKVMSALKGE